MNQIRLAAAAIRRALELRLRLKIPLDSALCPFDIAISLGIRLSLMAVPSLEGMYAAGPSPAIVISTLRPWGRQRFTCAHELGHHDYGHGSRLDEIKSSREFDVDEYLADAFAGAFLMPKLAVANAFSRRGWSPGDGSPHHVLQVAQDLGVGFTTLIAHMSTVLRILPSPTAASLRSASLPKLRASIDPSGAGHQVFSVDPEWGVRPLDVQVGDHIRCPIGSSVNGSAIVQIERSVFAAQAPGIAALELPYRDEPISVRVARKGFEGLARYRHLEGDSDD